MEELSHYKSLRNKYTKELSQTSAEVFSESRPQTAEKHVSFDFSEQLNIQELRNLREKKEIEFERLSVHSANDDDDLEREKQEKKRRKREKKERREKRRLKKEKKRRSCFEVVLKPAIDIEFVQLEPSEASVRSSLRGSYLKQASKHFSSHHSLYSEGSVCSKKSLVEEIEEAYKEAKKSLENSFKVDLDVVEVKSAKSSVNSARNEKFSRESQDKNEKNSENQRHSSFKQFSPEVLENLHQNQEVPKIFNVKDSKSAENDKKFQRSVTELVKTHEKSKNISMNQSNHDEPCNTSNNSKFSSQVLENSLKEVLKPVETSSKTEKSLKDQQAVETSSLTEKSLQSKTRVKEDPENLQIKKSSKLSKDENIEKFSSYNKNQIFSKLIEKPLNQPLESFQSDPEEEKSKEGSLKSSVDFTISDPTPFQSVKFSQDLNHDFNQVFTNFKKGVFLRILSPIIQHLAEDEWKDQNSNQNPEFRKTCFEDFSDHSPKGSEKLKKIENFEDFEFRTSRSEPFFTQGKTSNPDPESFNFSLSNPKFPESLEFNEISVLENPEKIENFQDLLKEKGSILVKSLARFEVRLTALNTWNSFFIIKAQTQYKKEKIEKVKLAQATFEFNLLQKVIQEWKNCVKHEKILGSRRFLQFRDRWDFVRLYQTFEGLKFVTRAHKEWISQVRKKRILAKTSRILKNWALFVRYRKVKTRILIKKAKFCLAGWKKLVEMKRVLNRKACVHWYLRKIFCSFSNWNDFLVRRREKWVKQVKADKVYCERLYTKVFLGWKHWKALEQTNFIPLRICTKTVLVKKNGTLREQNLLDIKIIKN